jgi:hypothetical protein
MGRFSLLAGRKQGESGASELISSMKSNSLQWLAPKLAALRRRKITGASFAYNREITGVGEARREARR